MSFVRSKCNEMSGVNLELNTYCMHQTIYIQPRQIQNLPLVKSNHRVPHKQIPTRLPISFFVRNSSRRHITSIPPFIIYVDMLWRRRLEMQGTRCRRRHYLCQLIESHLPLSKSLIPFPIITITAMSDSSSQAPSTLTEYTEPDHRELIQRILDVCKHEGLANLLSLSLTWLADTEKLRALVQQAEDQES